MDFRLSEDQEALRRGIRDFCEQRLAISQLREFERNAPDGELWNDFAEMGILDLRQPEAEGGLGLGTTEAMFVFEELGRCLAPGPLLWSHLAAGTVEGAGSGSVIVTGFDQVDHEGGPVLIEHLMISDVLVVLRADGVYRIDPKALESKKIAKPLDPFTPLHHVESLPQGDVIADAATAQRTRVEGTALAAALMLGIAEATQDLATAYAKDREQFDRPIGSFQAIKHILADCFVRQEIARAAVYAAGVTLDDSNLDDARRAAAAAKITAGEAAMKNSRACIQVHGGMGFTWENPAHFYLKRTWVLENAFGGVEYQADTMAALIPEQA